MQFPKLNATQQKLVSDNMLFARSLTKKFMRNWSLPRTFEDELFQEGLLGMCRAAADFNPDRGVKFITYAQAWVNLFLKEGYYRIVDTIKVPHRGDSSHLSRVDDANKVMPFLLAHLTPADISLDMARLKSQAAEYLTQMGVRQRNIDWYFELLEGELNQVEIAKKAGVNKNTVKSAMYQIRDLLAEWGKKMDAAA